MSENLPPNDRRRACILLADDNRDAADSMGMLLELAGYQVVVAHSGKQALALGPQSRPDVVILDIGMPDMNGYDVARSARATEWGKHAYFLAMTGWGESSDKHEAMQAGFDEHLTKPVDSDEVEKLVEAYIQSAEAKRRSAS